MLTIAVIFANTIYKFSFPFKTIEKSFAMLSILNSNIMYKQKNITDGIEYVRQNICKVYGIEQIEDPPIKMIYIKFIDKVDLLYNLWVHATWLDYIKEEDKQPVDKKTISDNIQNCINNDTELEFSILHGKKMFVDITTDYLDIGIYEHHNGNVNKLICQLKYNTIYNAYIKYLLS